MAHAYVWCMSECVCVSMCECIRWVYDVYTVCELHVCVCVCKCEHV